MPLRALLLFALHALLLVLGHWNHTNVCNHTRCAKAEGLRAGPSMMLLVSLNMSSLAGDS